MCLVGRWDDRCGVNGVRFQFAAGASPSRFVTVPASLFKVAERGLTMKHLGQWRRIWWVVGPLFLMALITASWLDDDDQAVLSRTLSLSLASAGVAIVTAIVAATALAGAALPKFLWRVVLGLWVALSVLPPYLNVSSWDAAFGKLGWLTSSQGQILQPLLSKWSAAIWVHAVGLVPPFTLLFFAAMVTKKTYEEQAKIDLSAAAVFFHMTLRRMLPLVIACVLWSVLVCSREIGVTDLYQIGTLAEQVYLGYSLGQVNSMAGKWSAEALAAAGSISMGLRATLFLLLAASSALFFWLLNDFSQGSQSSAVFPSDPLHRIPAATQQRLARGTLVVALAVLAAAPLLNLVLQLGTTIVMVDGSPKQVWTLANCYAIFVRTASEFRSAFVWSAVMALVASTVIVVTATAVCFWAATNRSVGWWMIGVTSLAASFSGPDIGSGVASFFAQSNNGFVIWLYDRTIVPAVIANIVFCWPMAIVVVGFAIYQTPWDQLESAQLDQVGFLRGTFEFGFWQNRALIGGVWMLVAAICFSELSASQMVLPPGIETVAQVTLGMLHAGVNQSTAALSLLTIGLVVALAIAGWIIGVGTLGRSRHHRPDSF